ncbi:MAG: hypothetical protein NC203_09050 [Firmicutes bacterium]|nr:hypothetical protein [Bacillota bacterium]
MSVFLMMLAVTACYTVTSLNDKYASSGVKFDGCQFTFLMCSSMTVFLIFSLPFQEIYFMLTWQSFAAVLLIAVCKLLEFYMSVLVLRQLSAFELKAWLGITLFASYFTDVIYGAALSVLKLICIAITVVGLILIVKSGGEKAIDYKKLVLPLMLYLAAKYGYGLVIKSFSKFASPIMQLLPALALIALVLLPKASPWKFIKRQPKGTAAVVLARIPNTIGMLIENAVISISLASYSFIQPMILVSLFGIAIIRREQYSKLNLIGGIICICGVILFQVAGNIYI